MPAVRAAAIVLVAAGCAASSRMGVVPRADSEERLAAEACVVAREALGPQAAHELLAGHVVRPGNRRVLFVREWRDGEPLPARRVTASIDPDLSGRIALPHPGVRLRADRARADGKEVRPLAVARGRLWLPRPNALDARVTIDLVFSDPGEPPLSVSRPLAEPHVDALDALEGRADRLAPPERFLRR
jgi:hypothetical protein